MIYQFLSTKDVPLTYGGHTYTGLGLPAEKTENIIGKNFLAQLGSAPKKIDLEKFRAYLKKYLPYVKKDSNREAIEQYCTENHI